MEQGLYNFFFVQTNIGFNFKPIRKVKGTMLLVMLKWWRPICSNLKSKNVQLQFEEVALFTSKSKTNGVSYFFPLEHWANPKGLCRVKKNISKIVNFSIWDNHIHICYCTIFLFLENYVIFYSWYSYQHSSSFPLFKGPSNSATKRLAQLITV